MAGGFLLSGGNEVKAAFALCQTESQLHFHAVTLVLIAEYLAQQHTLDKELQDKYNAFIKDLLADAESFMNLVDHAFALDFEDLLMNSAKLAKGAGVGEQEVLDSVEKVDAFFLE